MNNQYRWDGNCLCEHCKNAEGIRRFDSLGFNALFSTSDGTVYRVPSEHEETNAMHGVDVKTGQKVVFDGVELVMTIFEGVGEL